MKYKSTFDLMIGSALVTQIDVAAHVETYHGDWHITGVYADAIEINGQCPGGEAYVEIPASHPFHKMILDYFLNEGREDIDRDWVERTSRYPSFVHANSAGRSL